MKQIKLIVLAFFTLPCFGQLSEKKDFSAWGWIQLEKQTVKNQYITAQYQIRYSNNATVFDRSNFYLGYGFNYLKNFNTEVLYQYNSNYKVDQNTFYFGTSYKFKLFKNTSCFIRTAVQHTQNYFTGDYQADEPITEWRNRLRISYAINKAYSATISAEPYLAFDYMHSGYLSRVRYVSQLNLKYNKYQNFSLFYMIQPDEVTFKTPKIEYVLGLTYSIKLPNKWKDFKKFYYPKFLEYKDKQESDTKDSFN